MLFHIHGDFIIEFGSPYRPKHAICEISDSQYEWNNKALKRRKEKNLGGAPA